MGKEEPSAPTILRSGGRKVNGRDKAEDNACKEARDIRLTEAPVSIMRERRCLLMKALTVRKASN